MGGVIYFLCVLFKINNLLLGPNPPMINEDSGLASVLPSSWSYKSQTLAESLWLQQTYLNVK